ncbi:MAG TPA: YdeI/OmpD-associated family protein [Kofleriaceae bacterium]|jgi:uncharacterized protein YdeI (YjbR/CyaY-like superfamily)
MHPAPDDIVLPFADSAAFDKWLAKHHAKAPLVWIRYAKKIKGEPSINWTEAVDVALCYGWIDGQAQKLDEHHYLQRFTPRRAKSKWSKINRTRVERLIEEKRMRPAGLAEVEKAQADGRWDEAYDSPSTAEVPPELAAVLAKDKKAKAAFDKFTSAERYSLLYRLQHAKKAETRAKHIAAFVKTGKPK